MNPQIIASIFNRKRKESSNIVMPFDRFADDIQRLISQKINFGSLEEPALLSFVNSDRWILITTERLIGCRAGNLYQIRHELVEIVDIIPVELWPNAAYKAQGMDLRIITTLGEIFSIDVGEPGASRLAFLSALELAVQQAKNRRNESC
jgi:hypothetical protein